MAIEIPKTEHGWALRAYLVLIGYAYRGETMSDGELAQAIQCEDLNILHRALKSLVRWCTLTRTYLKIPDCCRSAINEE